MSTSRATALSEVEPRFVELARTLVRSEEFQVLLGGGGVLSHLPVPAAAWVVALLGAETGRSQLVVLPRESDALAFQEAAVLFGASSIYFPSPALSPYQETEASLLVRAQEAVALDAIIRDGCPLVVCTPRALFRRLPTPEDLTVSTFDLVAGEECNLEQLAPRLVELGYRRSDLVAEVGVFAVRGGVFDLFPPGLVEPVRLDMFGDVIESIRHFDLATQRSAEQVDQVRIRPLSLFRSGPAQGQRLAEALLERLEPEPGTEAFERVESLSAGEGFDGWENYLPLVEPTATLYELMSDCQLVVAEPAVLAGEIEHHGELLTAEFEARMHDQRLAVAPELLEVAAPDVVGVLERAEVVLDQGIGMEASTVGPNRIELVASPVARQPIDFGATETDLLVGQLPRFPREVETARARSERLFLVCPGERHGRVEEILQARGVQVGSGGVELVDGELRRGFRLPLASAVFFGEAQLFSSAPQRAAKRRRLGPFLSGLRDLKVGEYVVHEDHGIARFIGMRTVQESTQSAELPPSLQGVTAGPQAAVEVMELLYAGDRTLLLPLSRLDQLQRYSGLEGVSPRLDRLGGSSWNKTKSRIKRGLKKLATDLLKLYAQRELARAPAAGADTDLQNQFETDFEFEETPDQLEAIRVIKKDLERERPMDRLLCGDVGFGKTEVAMRAAFKMVDSGYQVAVLAPTTILADQHLRTFRQRFRGFPVKVDMVSRFRSTAEMRDIRERAARAEIDILIGTHRLLNRELHLPKLGLLVVDEEQRFGVGQKERLKELKREVHVLAMSATPVPRTLQMSLAGVRDLSTIESPPKDRMAVETKILPYSSELIREAIEYELERGGQVFYVYNRVEGIESMSQALCELIPDLRITIGHGQMDEQELSRRMRSFIAAEQDVLLATTIIENGIDIPNVNTMIVHRADRFGLAQLYQLRGRVGRSNQLAYCYLLVPSDQVLSSDARKRLTAIREFTELGAGFRIAARDLEIRGAGNLLGPEQSGHIVELGIETYLKMLEDTIRELRGEAPEEKPSAQIDLPISMSIPQDYIGDTNLRMEIYRRLAADEEQLAVILEELRDRFGPPPREVHNLIEIAELKRHAEALRVQSISAGKGKLVLQLRRDANVDVDRLIRFVSDREGASFSPDGALTLVEVPPTEAVAVARQTLQVLGPAPSDLLDPGDSEALVN